MNEHETKGLVTLAPGVRGALGPLAGAVESRLERFDADRVLTRLWRKDPTLWKADDPAHQQAIARRLGWLDAVAAVEPHLPALARLAVDARRDGFERAVLLGMGGSSLCAEVLALVFDRGPEGLPLTVLDSTVPAQVAGVLGGDLGRTLFVVASKSGTTIEVDSLYRYVAGRLPDEDRGARLVAITDPGTALDRLARERGFRHVFDNPADIGGRFSALSLFGMVPAALLGLDVGALLASARDMAARCGGERPARDNPAAWLGALVGEGARVGRDKVTLVAGPALAPLGRWIEQLVAESTGKEGQGALPVDGEPARRPGDYGDDRLFVGLRLAEEPDLGLAELAAEGHPVLELVAPDRAALGGEFLRWEVATALAGVVLGINPFDEPDVTDSKQRTGALLQRYRDEGALPEPPPVAEAEGVRLWADPGLRVDGAHPRDWLRAHFARCGPGDYVGLLAYLAPSPAHRAALETMRRTLLEGRGAATTLGWGPRFLHSTGQLFKGGPDTGVFLQITADDRPGREGRLDIPGAGYDFGTLARAQALGDLAALHDRGRRAVRVHLGGDVEAGLERLGRWLAEDGGAPQR